MDNSAEIKSSVEIEMLKFVTCYGSEMLISWLSMFEKVISTKDYPLYRNLEREACKACCISLSDMHLFSNSNCTNAKRIISFLSVHHLHLPIMSISKLLKASERNISYYISDAEGWISQPKSNKAFTDAYNLVINALKIQ